MSLEQKDGKITVSVNEDSDSNDRDETGTQNNDGQLDREELEIFAKVAESQAFMETELEVEYLTSDSEDEMLRQTRKAERAGRQISDSTRRSQLRNSARTRQTLRK